MSTFYHRCANQLPGTASDAVDDLANMPLQDELARALITIAGQEPPPRRFIADKV